VHHLFKKKGVLFHIKGIAKINMGLEDKVEDLLSRFTPPFTLGTSKYFPFIFV